jgi:hypothetical protein
MQTGRNEDPDFFGAGERRHLFYGNSWHRRLEPIVVK